MARAIRRAAKQGESPAEAIAKQAEELASDRFNLQLDGRGYVTEVDGDYAIDVAGMYRILLAT